MVPQVFSSRLHPACLDGEEDWRLGLTGRLFPKARRAGRQ